MNTSVLWVIFGIAVFYFGEVAYAIYRGRDFRTSLKVPFALFTFETKQHGDDTAANDEKKDHPRRIWPA
jgi:hypothetical protein